MIAQHGLKINVRRSRFGTMDGSYCPICHCNSERTSASLGIAQKPSKYENFSLWTWIWHTSFTQHCQSLDATEPPTFKRIQQTHYFWCSPSVLFYKSKKVFSNYVWNPHSIVHHIRWTTPKVQQNSSITCHLAQRNKVSLI